MEESIERANRFARESYERTISQCREFGIARVEYLVADDACAACKPLAGLTFELLVAPPLPLAGGGSELCRCAVVASFAEER